MLKDVEYAVNRSELELPKLEITYIYIRNAFYMYSFTENICCSTGSKKITYLENPSLFIKAKYIFTRIARIIDIS